MLCQADFDDAPVIRIAIKTDFGGQGLFRQFNRDISRLSPFKLGWSIASAPTIFGPLGQVLVSATPLTSQKELTR
jgi:hypothetical protein